MTTKSHKRIFVFSVVCPYNTRCEQHLEECNKERRTGIAQRQSPSLLIIFIIIIIIYRPIGLDFISFDLFFFCFSSFIRSAFFCVSLPICFDPIAYGITIKRFNLIRPPFAQWRVLLTSAVLSNQSRTGILYFIFFFLDGSRRPLHTLCVKSFFSALI